MSDPVLAVDLDGTLLRSDMLHETFWAAFARDWTVPFRALWALTGGRAALKARLAELALPDPAGLPYEESVLALIAARRAEGGRVALVTAADARVAGAVAAHLGVFDAVHASDGETNLKGPRKAEFLTQTYGARGFDYVGDARADLPVWKAARLAFSAGAHASVRAALDGARAAAGQDPATHLVPARSALPALARALRPHQWMKNALVFLPMIAAHAITGANILAGLAAFVAFSAVASSVYLLNDLLDLDADRAHPRKRKRPFASGALPLNLGLVAIPALMLAGLLMALMLDPLFGLVLVGYYLLTLAYSLVLKRKVVIDICVLATLYVLRIVAGAAAMEIYLSVWLMGFSTFLFLSLAAVKRVAELVDMVGRGLSATPGRGYIAGDLAMIGQVATSSAFAAVVVLMLYLNSPEVLLNYSSPMLLWGACLVFLYWMVRMILKAHRGEMPDDPVVFAVRDRISLLTFALTMALILTSALL